jgi:hypothetical protein
MNIFSLFKKNPVIHAPLSHTFNKILSASWKREDVRGLEGVESIQFESGDGCILKGWVYRASGQSNNNGTCFLMHGFCDTSASLFESARKLSKEYNITVVSFDHRYHGLSSKAPHYPTFGCYEAYDVQAAMDYADKHNFPKPYILQGTSLGGMAAQRAGIEDKRVAGMFLLSVPGWPWDAIGKNALLGTWAANLINAAYGWDVLNHGNNLRFSQDHNHRPLVCYVMGDNDRYDINKIKKVFEHWHNGETGEYDKLPSENIDCRKFFHTVHGAGHPEGDNYCVWDWENFKTLEKDFYDTILE